MKPPPDDPQETNRTVPRLNAKPVVSIGLLRITLLAAGAAVLAAVIVIVAVLMSSST